MSHERRAVTSLQFIAFLSVMRRFIFSTFFLSTLAYSHDTKLAEAFLAALQSESGYQTFQTQCRPTGGALDFEGRDELFAALDKAGSALAAKTALLAYERCTDGASRLALGGHLGNEFLRAHPAALAGALAQTNAPPVMYGRLAEAEPTEFFAVECNDGPCRKARREAFAKKRAALKKASVTGAAREARDQLLKALKSDR